MQKINRKKIVGTFQKEIKTVSLPKSRICEVVKLQILHLMKEMIRRNLNK
jgi:hypothetical protein